MVDRPDITIPEEARQAAIKAIDSRRQVSNPAVQENVTDAVLTAAAPLIVAAELEQLADGYDKQARALGEPHINTPASAMVVLLHDLADDLRARAAELRGGGK